jgi:hypothetical protein
VAMLESQVYSDEIATHGLNATLSGKDREIASWRLYGSRTRKEMKVRVEPARRRPLKWMS